MYTHTSAKHTYARNVGRGAIFVRARTERGSARARQPHAHTPLHTKHTRAQDSKIFSPATLRACQEDAGYDEALPS